MLPRLRDWLIDFGSEESGQGGTEYMLIVSVIVVAIVAASYTFVPMVNSGVQDLGEDVGRILRTGKIGDDGMGRFNGVAAPGLNHIAPHTVKPSSLLQEMQSPFVPGAVGHRI